MDLSFSRDLEVTGKVSARTTIEVAQGQKTETDTYNVVVVGVQSRFFGQKGTFFGEALIHYIALEVKQQHLSPRYTLSKLIWLKNSPAEIKVSVG